MRLGRLPNLEGWGAGRLPNLEGLGAGRLPNLEGGWGETPSCD